MYQATKYMTPQYKRQANENKFGSAQKANINRNETEERKQLEIQIIHEENDKVIQDKKQKDKEVLTEAEKNGFCFGNNSVSPQKQNTMVIDKKKTENVRTKSSTTYNGSLGSYAVTEENSEDVSSENVAMDNHKPLKRRNKPKTRSPLKDKKIDNDTNKKRKIIPINDNANDDNDDLAKKKDDDSLSPHKENSVSPQQSMHDTSISIASRNATDMILNDEMKPIS